MLASLALSVLLSSLGTSIVNVALPTMAGAFGASFQAVQWVVLSYLLGVTTLAVSAGRLGDLAGRRRLLLAGIVLFTLASALCAAAPSLALLIAARAVQGVGAAAMLALAMALVSDASPQARTGSAMGLLGTMSAVGTALGPSVGGVLIATLGWRAIFLAVVPLGILAVVLAWRYLPRDPARGGETAAAAPLIRLAMLRNPVLRAGLIMTGLVTTVLMATLVVGPFYLARALGLDAASVGLVMSIGPAVAALTGVPAGRMVDRYGSRRVTIAGLVGAAAGALMLATLPATLGVAGYVASIVVTTAGYAVFQAANNTTVMTDAAANQRGAIAGLLNLSRNLGLIAGASAMGWIFTLASATRDIATASPGAIASGMRLTFAVAALLLLVALGVASGRSTVRVAARRSLAWIRSDDVRQWLAPALLIGLSLVPAVAGAARVVELAHGGDVTPANARFFAMPLPVVLHILSVIPYSIGGAFQFAPVFRRRHPGWHRAAGRTLGVFGLVAALSGLWMAHFYPWPEGDGEILYLLRLLFGSAMVVSIVLGVDAVRRRDFIAHGAWMMRAYAIGLGAGTQALTHLPWFVLFGTPGELSRAALMAAGWVINVAVAEWIIRRRRQPAATFAPRNIDAGIGRRSLQTN